MPKKKRVDFFEEIFENFGIPISWDCFVAVLKRKGFEQCKSRGGSACIFICGNERLIVHKPHGGDKIVSKFSRERAIEAIERIRGENS